MEIIRNDFNSITGKNIESNKNKPQLNKTAKETDGKVSKKAQETMPQTRLEKEAEVATKIGNTRQDIDSLKEGIGSCLKQIAKKEEEIKKLTVFINNETPMINSFKKEVLNSDDDDLKSEMNRLIKSRDEHLQARQNLNLEVMGLNAKIRQSESMINSHLVAIDRFDQELR